MQIAFNATSAMLRTSGSFEGDRLRNAPSFDKEVVAHLYVWNRGVSEVSLSAFAESSKLDVYVCVKVKARSRIQELSMQARARGRRSLLESAPEIIGSHFFGMITIGLPFLVALSFCLYSAWVRSNSRTASIEFRSILSEYHTSSWAPYPSQRTRY